MQSSFVFLPCAAGEGDRRSRWRGRAASSELDPAPSTTLRAVPLPHKMGEEISDSAIGDRPAL
jgi:hypothetical protein